MQSSIDQYIGSQEAVASLMDLKSGVEGGGGGAFLRGANGGLVPSRRIEGVVLAQERIRHLFLRWVHISFSTVQHQLLPSIQIFQAGDCPIRIGSEAQHNHFALLSLPLKIYIHGG